MANKIELTINGKNYTATLGLRLLQAIDIEENVKMDKLEYEVTENALFFVPKLLWHSINILNKKEGKELIDIDVIFDWIDETGIANPEILNFLKSFFESLSVHIPQDPKAVGKPKAVAKPRAKK